MKKIEYKGIKTNNLKNIDIDFFQNDLVLICGDSGSGKSSLAFDTIAAINQNEFEKLMNDNISDIKYDVDYYSNVIPTVALKQLNFNVNPRSTIISYFGLFKPVSLLINEISGIGMKEISSNGPNRCKKCNGLGYNLKISLESLVDFQKKVKDMPFVCWQNSYKDYYQQSLNLFCDDNKIDINLSFANLNEKQKQILLYGVSKEKYKINYKNAGKRRKRTAYYIGPVTEIESSNTFVSNKRRFMKECLCEDCNGSRLNKRISSIKLNNSMSVSDLLTSDFYNLNSYLHSLPQEKYSKRVKEAIKHLIRFLNACEKVNITHLSLSRSISSLSGGELQRLRMVQLLMGKIDNLMIVLDEPTASLHPIEADNIIDSILDLNKNNTIILVEHNYELINKANKVFYLGPGGGKRGGNLINIQEYFQQQNYDFDYIPSKINHFITISLKSEFVNYLGQIKFAENCMNGICGKSGIGKTTILKEILPLQIDNYKYISQKPLKGNSNSTVASYTGILDEIRKIYSKTSKLEKSMFSNFSDGACTKCSGLGKIVIGDFYDEKIFETCSSCNGTGYSKKALSTKVFGYNIAEILELEVNEIKNLNIASQKIKKIISILDKLDLSHIKLNQKISTLSGGENQRIKLAMALLDNKATIIGLDEPTKGLSKRSIIKLINILYEDIHKNGKTYIIAEHNPMFLSNCTFINELDKKNNNVEVLCSGSPEQIKNNKKSIIKNWINTYEK